MNTESKLGVALVHHICPACGCQTGEEILMNTRLSVPMAKKVEAAHGKAIGYEWCDTCKEASKIGVGLIQVDEAKTTDQTDPWRTGKVTFIKDEAYLHIFGTDKLPERKLAYLTIEAWDKIGLP